MDTMITGDNEMLIIAMRYLRDLIADGIEFPDAVWKTSRRYQIDHVELEQAYDQGFTE